MIALHFWIFICVCCFNSCEKEELIYINGDIELKIETGEYWLHDFPLFFGFNKKNAPQFAIWIEDTRGNYLSTVFVTYKTATEGWQANKGNRRKESLPHWSYQRGVIYEDGLLLPTKDQPLTDGITGATPKEDKTILVRPISLQKPFVIKAEFNHSVDFNDFFPENALEGADNYSGGKEGSGQPAIVYATTIYPETSKSELEMIGYSSPDGSSGTLETNFEVLTSATSIVSSIKVTLK